MSGGAESFRAAMAHAGLAYDGPITPDGNLHRFKADGDHERNSWYVLHGDAPMAGAFGCWKRQVSETWCERKPKDCTQAEWDAVRDRWRRSEAEHARTEDERQRKAGEVAVWILGRSDYATRHPYLEAKGVRSYGELRLYKGALALPLRDIYWRLCSLQFIGEDGGKKFLRGGKVSGCFFAIEAAGLLLQPWLEPQHSPLVLCEGYATGASIREATGYAILCAMDCGNLMAVAKAARAKWPEREIIVAADNDARRDDNPGVTKATAAAKAIGASLAVPQFSATGTDFNDLAQAEGLEAVRIQLAAATKASGPDEAQDADQDLVTRFGCAIFTNSEGKPVALNERFFAGRFEKSGHVIFDPSERTFYRYEPSSGLWHRASDDQIREELSGQIVDYGRQRNLALEAKVTTARTGAVLQSLRGISEKRDAFCRRVDTVHVSNGVIRFGSDNSATLTQFKPEDYSRNRCPIAFDPEAECPRFYNELLAPVLPDEDIDLIQRWAGLAVAGVNPAQRIFILDGLAETGKSQLARILQLIVGAENCAQLRTELLFQRFEIFRFIGKTLLLAPDVPGDFLNKPSASVLKSLVGGDPLTAEAKGSNAVFTLSGDFNVLITANSRLRVRLDGDDGAWRRRLIIIRFDRQREGKRIAKFADVLLREEGPGILRWCLAGLLRARDEITETGDLALTTQQKGRVDALLCESDSVRRFIQERTAAGHGDVTSQELLEAYFHFCADFEWTPQPSRVVERALPDALLELRGASKNHCVTRHGRQVRGWSGVTLLTSENQGDSSYE